MKNEVREHKLSQSTQCSAISYLHTLGKLNELKKTVKEEEPWGPFAEQMLESLSLELNCPKEWKDLSSSS